MCCAVSPAGGSGSFLPLSVGFGSGFGSRWLNTAETLWGWGSRPTPLGKVGHGGDTGLTGGYLPWDSLPSSRWKGQWV